MSEPGSTPPSDRPIAIAGFMGVGKSKVGRRVADGLGRAFFDSDEVVVDRLGQPIPQLFSEGNEQLFRDTEEAVIAELVAARPPAVIALGGGALARQKTRELLLTHSILVHLSQPWEQLRPALSHLAAGRPLLQGKSEAEIHELYLARQHDYAVAHLVVTTTRRGTARACEDVLGALQSAYGPLVEGHRPLR